MRSAEDPCFYCDEYPLREAAKIGGNFHPAARARESLGASDLAAATFSCHETSFKSTTPALQHPQIKTRDHQPPTATITPLEHESFNLSAQLSTSKTTKPECPLLKLPAELRNEIYELAFTKNTEEVDLLDPAKPPSTALLRTCRQIYSEAKSIYEEAYERFWTDSNFMIELTESNKRDLKGMLENIRDEELNKICHLRLHSPQTIEGSLHYHRCEMLPDKRNWYESMTRPRRTGHHLLRVGSWNSRKDRTDFLIVMVRSRERAVQRAAEGDEDWESAIGVVASLREQIISLIF